MLCLWIHCSIISVPQGIILMASFLEPRYLMLFHWNLSGHKCPQYSLFLIFWPISAMVSISPPIYNTPIQFQARHIQLGPFSPSCSTAFWVILLSPSACLSHFDDNHFTLLRVFRTTVSWWFLTGVWVTASLLKSPGLFWVLWPILKMMSLG